MQSEMVSVSFTKKHWVSVLSTYQILVNALFINNKGYIGVAYRSPSQDALEFQNFLSNFETILCDTATNNALFTIVLGDCNARFSVWWTNGKTTTEGTKLESLTTVHGFHQLISQPSHLMPQSSSCVDLNFTDQPSSIVDSAVHPSLHSNCHHQITYCKLNLNIKYPPPYGRLVWDYSQANVESIKKSFESVNWELMFGNKSVHKQVSIFNETLMNIFSNFTPNKLVTFDDRDPPWMNDFVKVKLNRRTSFITRMPKMVIFIFKDHLNLQEATNLVSEVITKRKQDYHNNLASRLNNPGTSAKTYWSILKTFYNGEKIPVIAPLLINNKLVSNFKEKADHFNCFFASHCTPLDNNSKITETQTFLPDNKLSSIQFEDNDIIKIIRSLNFCKAHGHDDISIRMLKLCDVAAVKPLSIIFRNCVNQSTFPDVWKKSNICPIHKKGDKRVINNYRPVSLQPICAKIFERLIFNSLFEYLKEHNLLSAHQSGFRANDFCVNQLLSLVHDIYTVFFL